MRGHFLRKVWRYDPALYAPPKYRRACEYQVFVPVPLADFSISLPGDVSTVLSEAETATARLNSKDHPAFVPLAKLLLRTESIASSLSEPPLAPLQGASETDRTGLGGMTTILAGPTSCRLRRKKSLRLSTTCVISATKRISRRSCSLRSRTRSSKPSIPSKMATVGWDERWSRCSCAGEASPPRSCRRSA